MHRDLRELKMKIGRDTFSQRETVEAPAWLIIKVGVGGILPEISSGTVICNVIIVIKILFY